MIRADHKRRRFRFRPVNVVYFRSRRQGPPQRQLGAEAVLPNWSSIDANRRITLHRRPSALMPVHKPQRLSMNPSSFGPCSRRESSRYTTPAFAEASHRLTWSNSVTGFGSGSVRSGLGSESQIAHEGHVGVSECVSTWNRVDCPHGVRGQCPPRSRSRTKCVTAFSPRRSVPESPPACRSTAGRLHAAH